VSATYLVRFDDLCPSMRWSIWDPVEEILDGEGIRPIVAVIPDNADPSMRIEPAREDFWERVRGWQARGWTIGLHGHRHLYTSSDPGSFGWNARSEFAGHSRSVQEASLRAGLKIFEREQVRADVWVAPNHAFDATTVALLAELGLPVISDGLALHPYRDERGLFWVPCQLWGFRRRAIGTWTVCLHPNAWGPADVMRFARDVRSFRNGIVDLPETVRRFDHRKRSALDVGLLVERRLRRAVRRRIRGAPDVAGSFSRGTTGSGSGSGTFG
jgi:predicted deacetylase